MWIMVLYGKQELNQEVNKDECNFMVQGCYPENIYDSSLVLTLLC